MLDFIILFVVGMLWGLTDYFMEFFFKNYVQVKDKNPLLRAFKFVVSNYKPIVCFLLNQSASVLFFFSLGSLSLSLTVMISNTTSFLTATSCEIIHKKKTFGFNFSLGLVFVVTGMGLCLYNRQEATTQ